MNAWIGKSLVVIGIIHTLFGIGIGYTIFGQMAREGLFNTVVMQHDRNAAFWFMYAGFALLLLGFLLDWCERTLGQVPRFLGWSLLVLTVPSVVIMPQSGLWLLLVPSIGLILRSRRQGPGSARQQVSGGG